MGAMSLPGGTPETITEWRAIAQSLLTQEACAFPRNVEISTSYAWIYKRAYSSMPCVLPHPAAADPASVVAGLCCPNAQRHAGGHLRRAACGWARGVTPDPDHRAHG